MKPKIHVSYAETLNGQTLFSLLVSHVSFESAKFIQTRVARGYAEFKTDCHENKRSMRTAQCYIRFLISRRLTRLRSINFQVRSSIQMLKDPIQGVSEIF